VNEERPQTEPKAPSAILLDVNVLLALFDPMHQHHSTIRTWYETNHLPVASCALTELGFVRISCNPRYPNPMDAPEQAIALLRALHADARHRFWADSPSAADAGFLAQPFNSHKDTTDRYLLRLAIHHHGQLLTLDAGIRACDATELAALQVLRGQHVDHTVLSR
jgi:uncharacterized protein